MQHQENTFVNNQGLSIYTQAWLPDGPPRAVIFMVHGLAEHSGRYGEMATWFSERGFACYALDLPGHGKSKGTRVYIDQFLDFIATLRQYQEQLLEQYPELPFFHYGHSMGGLISIHYLRDYQEDFSAAVLSAALSRVPSNINAMTITMGRLFSRLLPKMPLVAIDSEGITSDPEANRIYDEDPLVYRGKTTARLAAELLSAMQAVPDAATDIELPVKIIHGDHDPLVDPDYSPYLHDLIAAEDKDLKLYPGLYHEIHQEKVKEQVFGDILNWYERHLP